MAELPEWVKNDPEWAATLHILDSHALRRKNTGQWVHFDRREIEVVALLDEAVAWSSGERLLVQVACDLFNGSGGASFGELIRILDDKNMAVVLEAIQILRGEDCVGQRSRPV